MPTIPAGLCQCGCGQRTQQARQNFPAKGLKTGDYFPYVRGHHWYSWEPEQFWSQLHQVGDCLEWGGSRDKRGYGDIHFGGLRDKTHRLAYLLTYGAIPTGLNVCHTCDNPKCCRPGHLFLGTTLENNRDRHRKGRTSQGPAHMPAERVARGESHPHAKLSSTQVTAIRERYARGERNQSALAREYGVSHFCIWSIVTQKNWKKAAS